MFQVKHTINNVSYRVLNVAAPPIVQAARNKTGFFARVFQALGFLVWVLIAIVAIGRCSAHAQYDPPSGWTLPQPRGQSPDTLRCVQRGADWVCTDKREQTTCRMQGFEWVCDRRPR